MDEKEALFSTFLYEAKKRKVNNIDSFKKMIISLLTKGSVFMDDKMAADIEKSAKNTADEIIEKYKSKIPWIDN